MSPLAARWEPVVAGAAWAPTIVSHLLRASLAGGLAVALVWLVCRLAPRLPAALRCGLWWLVGLKLLLALAWVQPLAVPLPASLVERLPALAGFSSVAGAVGSATAGAPSIDIAVGATRAGRSPGPAATPDRAALWAAAASLVLLALWVAGLAAGALRTAGELIAVRRILRRARPAASPSLVARFAALAERVGLRRAPVLALSTEVAAPLTVGQSAGLWRHAVVLPAARELSSRELDMALCHELVHVRRGDLWLGAVPAAAARLFFFHPLVHLAVREYALAREAACDAEVLARLAAPPAAYGRLLLALGAAGHRPNIAALGAAPSPGTLKRRLLMLDSPTRRPRALSLWLAGLAALAALVPLRIVAQPSSAGAGRSTHSTVESGRQVEIDAEGAGEETFLLRAKNGDVTRSGSAGDLPAAAGEGLWFRRDGHAYVVHDAGVLAQAEELFAPQQELGARQGKLGAEQGALGERQGKLGAEQGDLGGRLGSLAARQANIAEGERQRLEAEEAKLSREMDDLARQQEELGKQQEALGQKQEKLGEEQERLGREADAKLKTLLDGALARGLAQEIR